MINMNLGMGVSLTVEDQVDLLNKKVPVGTPVIYSPGGDVEHFPSIATHTSGPPRVVGDSQLMVPLAGFDELVHTRDLVKSKPHQEGSISDAPRHIGLTHVEGYNLNEIVAAIHQLNVDIFNLVDLDERLLSLTTTGFEHIITFLGIQVWNSEDNTRHGYWAEADDDFKTFLRRELIDKIGYMKILNLGESE